ncbi:MAG: DegQ family serine endoprotease [Pseudomonadota bacterium]
MRRILVILLLTLAFSGGAVAEDRLWIEKEHPAKAGRESVHSETFSTLAAELSPAMVCIQIKRQVQGSMGRDPFYDYFFGFPPRQGPQVGEGLGSGFIINPDGYILTNNHVVADAVSVTVSLADGTEYPAKLVGADPRTDLALLKIDGAKGLTALPLGDSDALRIGEWVMAIGNPFGLSHTVTAGIVSAKGRKEVQPGAEPMYANFIQTDASINPGNSGGPLLNMAGEVVGINTAIVRSGQGIGFAIPSNMAKILIPQLATGKVERSWLGVAIQEMTPPLAKSLGLERPEGALVRNVYPDSPAMAAGLEAGDVIVAFGGEPVKASFDLSWMAATAGAGAKVEVTLIREGRRVTKSVVMGDLADAGRKVEKEIGAEQKNGSSTLVGAGLTLGDLTPPERRNLGAPSNHGVAVTGVAAGSMAAEAGFRPGDVILRMGTRPVSDVASVVERFARVKIGTPVPFHVLRGGEQYQWLALVKE